MKTTHKLWIGLAILIALSPLGIFLPEHYKAGDAWGEWGVDSLKELVGYVPEGLAKLSQVWRAPLPDYAFHGWGEKGLGHLSIAYIISAAAGIAVVVLLMFLIGRILIRKRE